jgi:glycosyltransferase involved in cell wall biosynthesis
MANITGIVITLNESGNIEDCLKSLGTVCNELIVVDSNSTDDTVAKAQALGAKVYSQSYLGDGFQKNVGLAYATNKWILSMDADERITPEMVADIKNLDLDNTEQDAFAFRRRNLIGSRWVKRCGWYPDYCTRLYNREKTKFAEVKQHAYVPAKNLKYLKSDIEHFSFKNIGELFSKPGRPFALRGAKILYQKGKRANCFSPFVHGANSFLRKYIFELGFLGGVDGLTVSLSSCLNSYLKYAMLLEMQRDKKVLDGTNFKKIW